MSFYDRARKWFMERGVFLAVSLAFVIMAGSELSDYLKHGQILQSGQLIQKTNRVLIQLEDILAEVRTAEAGQRSFLLTGLDRFLKPYHEATVAVQQKLLSLKNMYEGDSSRLTYFFKLENLTRQRFEVMDFTLQLYRNKGSTSAVKAVMGGEGQKLMEEIVSLVRTMEGLEHKYLTEKSVLEKQQADTWSFANMAGNLISCGIAFFALWYTNRDRARRTVAEQKIRASEERVRALLSGVKDYAICMLDRSGRVVGWNEAAEGIHGYGSEEILERPFSCFYTKKDVKRGKPEHELKLARLDGRFEEEGLRVRKDGTTFQAHVILTALMDDAGGLSGYTQVIRDLSGKKNAAPQSTPRLVEQEEVRRAIAEVRGKLTFKDDPA